MCIFCFVLVLCCIVHEGKGFLFLRRNFLLSQENWSLKYNSKSLSVIPNSVHLYLLTMILPLRHIHTHTCTDDHMPAHRAITHKHTYIRRERDREITSCVRNLPMNLIYALFFNRKTTNIYPFDVPNSILSLPVSFWIPGMRGFHNLQTLTFRSWKLEGATIDNLEKYFRCRNRKKMSTIACLHFFF